VLCLNTTKILVVFDSVDSKPLRHVMSLQPLPDFGGGIRLLLGDKRKGEKEKRKGRRKKEKGNSEFHLMAYYPLNII